MLTQCPAVRNATAAARPTSTSGTSVAGATTSMLHKRPATHASNSTTTTAASTAASATKKPPTLTNRVSLAPSSSVAAKKPLVGVSPAASSAKKRVSAPAKTTTTTTSKTAVPVNGGGGGVGKAAALQNDEDGKSTSDELAKSLELLDLDGQEKFDVSKKLNGGLGGESILHLESALTEEAPNNNTSTNCEPQNAIIDLSAD